MILCLIKSYNSEADGNTVLLGFSYRTFMYSGMYTDKNMKKNIFGYMPFLIKTKTILFINYRWSQF